MEMIDLYERAVERTGATMAGVKPEQLSDPTPCTEWDVRTLINHMVGENHLWVMASEGQEIPPASDIPDFAADDPGTQYNNSAKVAVEMFRSPGSLEKTFTLPIGDTPGSVTLMIALMEAAVHGWDLAVATGQDTAIDDDIATAAMPIAQGLDASARGPQGSFAAIVEVPAEAPPGDRLLGLLGRDPNQAR